LNELRTLPEELAEKVARFLVAAENALLDDDFETARAYVDVAKFDAGRVAAVREAAAIVYYLSGDYESALSELRAVRRMTGSQSFVPLMADCERGMGRPQKALDFIKGIDMNVLDTETRIEVLLVASGARADLGQVDAAVLVLQVPELNKLPDGDIKARLQYGYADALLAAGREEDAQTWMKKAAASDINDSTDAQERLETL
jgi:predicted Zn-dependent protease